MRASPSKPPGLQQLRRYAIARSLFKPTSLSRAIARLGFLQADPLRAPARAQDLILAHRVENYRAGELERRYPRLGFEEVFFINYGFLPRQTLTLLHPRGAPRANDSWDAKMHGLAREMLAFVRERGRVRAKEAQAHFEHGSIKRWGANLNVSAYLLEGLHHRGLLRVTHRDAGTRTYQAVEYGTEDDNPEARLARASELLDIVVRLYAPLPAASLTYLCRLMRQGVSHLDAEIRQVQERAESLYAHTEVDGVRWLWPQEEKPKSIRHRVDDKLRFLAPFDPLVWDRRRFQLLWGWEYKFEAYVPARMRRMGHYAMPMLWGEEMLGWGNFRVVKGRLQHELGFAGPRPRSRDFQRALADALQRMHAFLDL